MRTLYWQQEQTGEPVAACYYVALIVLFAMVTCLQSFSRNKQTKKYFKGNKRPPCMRYRTNVDKEKSGRKGCQGVDDGGKHLENLGPFWNPTRPWRSFGGEGGCLTGRSSQRAS